VIALEKNRRQCGLPGSGVTEEKNGVLTVKHCAPVQGQQTSLMKQYAHNGPHQEKNQQIRGCRSYGIYQNLVPVLHQEVTHSFRSHQELSRARVSHQRLTGRLRQYPINHGESEYNVGRGRTRNQIRQFQRRCNSKSKSQIQVFHTACRAAAGEKNRQNGLRIVVCAVVEVLSDAGGK
jgi:hypothetical protein